MLIPDMEFVKSLTLLQDSHFFNFTREKRVNRDIFGQKLRMEHVYSSNLNKLSVFVQLSTQKQTHSSSFVKNQV